MCQRTTYRHPLFCILPPHILRAIAQNGTPQQRTAVMRTLATDNTFRALRTGTRLAAPAVQRRPDVLAVEGQK
jgi:hypothetical protein